MQNDTARRWSLAELAAHACLSTSRYGDLFKESFGVTPLTYLSILRVQEMARLIRETDLLITTITERVGWCYHSGRATIAFRRYMGVTPFEYRAPRATDRELRGAGHGCRAGRSRGLSGVPFGSPAACHVLTHVLPTLLGRESRCTYPQAGFAEMAESCGRTPVHDFMCEGERISSSPPRARGVHAVGPRARNDGREPARPGDVTILRASHSSGSRGTGRVETVCSTSG